MDDKLLDFDLLYKEFFWEIVSLIFGVVGIVFAILERKARIKSEEREREEVWLDIINIKTIMENQERIGENYRELRGKYDVDISINDEILSNIHTTHSRAANLLARKFSDAINLEKNFGIKEAYKWSKLGKISSKWQMHLILSLVKSENINQKLADNLDSDFSTWHQINDKSTFLSNPEQDRDSIIFEFDDYKKDKP